ncbi:hypothetical protein [Klebsiella pneumoniae]|uniref:hypothetical protein n=1 Tax=Klebsiella pneumoniae TaxID=573 RepID=UPI00388CF900
MKPVVGKHGMWNAGRTGGGHQSFTGYQEAVGEDASLKSRDVAAFPGYAKIQTARRS